MSFDSRFGPAAQTPQQRTFVLQQMQELVLSLAQPPSAYAQQLYGRYVSGELSWPQMRQAFDLAAGQNP